MAQAIGEVPKMYYSGASLKRMNNRKGKPWRGVLQYKDPETQKWRQITKVFPDCLSKSEAKVELAKWREQKEEEAALRDSGRTVEVAIRGHLSNQKRLNTISLETYQNSLRLAETIIFPLIGRMPFIGLTKTDVQDFINELARKGYKPSSTRTIFAIVSKTYKEAYRRDEIISDPTKGVVLPRDIKGTINYLDIDSRRKFLSLMTKSCGFYLPAMIAYYTGMRAGEICALQWKDINLATKTIRVNKTAKDYRTDSGKHEVEISNPKTPKSVRTIPIIKELEEILSDEAKAKKPKLNDYVVEWRNPRLLCTSFLKWATRNEVIGEAGKPISMHGLRHTFATLGVASGMDIKSLSSILGHSSTAMTLDTYASDDEQAKQLAMSNLSALFQNESENDL